MAKKATAKRIVLLNFLEYNGLKKRRRRVPPPSSGRLLCRHPKIAIN